VVVVGVRMPPSRRKDSKPRGSRAEHPGTAILVLSQYVETRYALDLLRDDPCGVGYLLKDRVTRISELTDAVRRVANGGSVIDPEVVSRLLGRPRRHSPLEELTRREREVLSLMAEGRSNLAIAERLSLDPRTVEGHVGTIFSKFGLEPTAEDHRRVLAVLTFLRAPAGVFSTPPPGRTARRARRHRVGASPIVHAPPAPRFGRGPRTRLRAVGLSAGGKIAGRRRPDGDWP
jgi:DNA-binding NarL/FixJ family response regulator